MKRQGKVETLSPEFHVRFTETLYYGLSRQDLTISWEKRLLRLWRS
jgi:hypothetical protein